MAAGSTLPTSSRATESLFHLPPGSPGMGPAPPIKLQTPLLRQHVQLPTPRSSPIRLWIFQQLANVGPNWPRAKAREITMRLFHFSEDGSIEAFEPQPVAVPAVRRAGQDWLNGPLVWAIDDWHQSLYLFPRDCPRVLIWATEHSTQSEKERWLAGTKARMLAFIEDNWAHEHSTASIWRYELPLRTFESVEDAGMWVSRERVTPLAKERVRDLPKALGDSGVELRVIPSLSALKEAWNSSLHVSGIRLRNSTTWTAE